MGPCGYRTLDWGLMTRKEYNKLEAENAELRDLLILLTKGVVPEENPNGAIDEMRDEAQKWKDLHTEVEIERDNRIPIEKYNEQVDAYLELHDELLVLKEKYEKAVEIIKGLASNGLTIYDAGIWENLPVKDQKLIMDQGLELIKLNAKRILEELEEI